ncbi:MAG: Gfo/Idh/MocA family oxidoreductase [Sedimentisphaerales bacterium]|nr:Gfo/Idh/MocA family oxidoreductase [Sedimentisphaerales bacterium]
MSQNNPKHQSRRRFLRNSGRIVAASALTAGIAPNLYAAGGDTIKVALIGCGGRGTGAAGDALSVNNGQIKLVAMADVFQHRLDNSYKNLSRGRSDQVDVPKDRQFLGFDAYKQAMDCLGKGDVVILATPPAFRWVHFTEAIKKGLNVFMEKPVTVDGPTTKRMIELAKQASEKNLKCGVGLMVRHCRGRRELKQRIDNGEIGDIILMRGYRMGGRASTCRKKPDSITEVLYQIQRFHSFIWASGGMYNDYYIHQIDELSWMKGAWPTEAHALGGRHYRDDYVDQNLDTYDVEYTYPDGARLFYQGRNMSGCKGGFSSFVHGTKGSAIVSKSGHTPGKVCTYKDQNMADANIVWRYPQPERSPYRLEWVDLIEAIRDDKPYNEVERGAIASMVSSMGRMAAHTGQVITYDQMLNCPHELAPDADKLTNDGPAPVPANEDGTYPVPKPGILKDREY